MNDSSTITATTSATASASESATAAMAGSVGLVGAIAESVGAPEPVIRLLITIFAGYPIAIIYRCFIVQQTVASLHHVYFVVWGLLLYMFNYGSDIYHSMIAICVTHVLVRLLRNAPRPLLCINFVFHMTYLLVGYYFTESGDYDILWTMPHCVLTLRLIGFVFDLTDGQKPTEQLSKDQKETALAELPSLLELSAFAYFPCAFLVGPQFPFRRYKRFINGEFRKYKGDISAGIKRMLLGVLYLAVRQVGAMMLPDDYFLTDAYRNQPFVWRLIYLGLWGKLSLYKYISCWLLTEGALMSIGLSYVGKDAHGKEDWSGCSNVKLWLLETGFTMQHYVQSFNVNTNQWVAHYVYKRLKFLNNRTISYAAALGFLAVWHGFHSGYYMAFIMEYMIVTVEKQIESMYMKGVMPKYGHILNESMSYTFLMVSVLKAYNIIYMGWCLTPFIFLTNSRWMRVFSAVNYFGFIYIAFWSVVYQVYKRKRHTKRSPTPAINAETEQQNNGQANIDDAANMDDVANVDSAAKLDDVENITTAAHDHAKAD